MGLSQVKETVMDIRGDWEEGDGRLLIAYGGYCWKAISQRCSSHLFIGVVRSTHIYNSVFPPR